MARSYFAPACGKLCEAVDEASRARNAFDRLCRNPPRVIISIDSAECDWL
jgi:hypothetical protein